MSLLSHCKHDSPLENLVSSEEPPTRSRLFMRQAGMHLGMDILTRRGIEVVPDIVANAGGVIASMEEYSRSLSAMKTPQGQMFATIRDLLGAALDQTMERSRAMGITLSEAAVSLAMERVYDAMRRRRMI